MITIFCNKSCVNGFTAIVKYDKRLRYRDRWSDDLASHHVTSRRGAYGAGTRWTEDRATSRATSRAGLCGQGGASFPRAPRIARV